MPAPRTPLELGLAALAGAAAGSLGSGTQLVVVGGRRLPLGVVLGVALAASVVVLVQAAARSPWAGSLAAVGWFAVVVLASSPRREGDLLIVGDAHGWGFVVGGGLAVAAAVALHRRPAPVVAR